MSIIRCDEKAIKNRIASGSRRIRPLLFQIGDLEQGGGSYALEAERKLGQLAELAKKNPEDKGIGPICYSWFTQAARERQWLSRPTAPSNWDIFSP